MKLPKLNVSKITLLVLGLFAVTSVSLTIYQMNRDQKFVIVDLAQLYNEFEMKKQLEGQMTNVVDVRQKTLDSLELSLNILSRTIQGMDADANKEAYEAKANEFEVRRQQYLSQQNAIAQDNEAMQSQYNEQIWKQLNQYVEDYGKANAIECIIGGDGSGNVMYSEDGLDLTDELVVYCNERYQGETRK
jgi:outer membrane protein